MKAFRKVIVAIPETQENDKLVELILKNKASVFRGSENNVLERYYGAAVENKSNNIVRITADCPLHDPYFINYCASEFLNNPCDYLHTASSYPEGMDIELFTFAALDFARKNAALSSEFEHVTLYIRNHPELFKLKTIEFPYDASNYRIALDELEDFMVIKAIIEHFHNQSVEQYGFEEIKTFLDANPEVYAINNAIIRNEGLLKSLEKDKLV